MRGFSWWLAAALLLVLVAPLDAKAGPEATGPAAARTQATGPRGAVVLGVTPTCRADAKALARLVYRDAALRPALEENTARALIGEPSNGASPVPPSGEEPKGEAPPPASPDPPSPEPSTEIVDVVAAISAACAGRCEASAVGRRLLGSLGRDLGARLVVVVQCDQGGEDGPGATTARVLDVPDERFVPLVLTARRVAADSSGPVEWPDAVRVLRALAAPVAKPKAPAAARRPTRAPRRTPAKPAPIDRPAAPGADEAEENGDWDLLSSPWFWGGLGVLVAAGITVFALSQTSLNDPDTVVLEGRVAP